MGYLSIPPRNSQDTPIELIYQAESAGSILDGVNQPVPKSLTCVEVDIAVSFLICLTVVLQRRFTSYR